MLCCYFIETKNKQHTNCAILHCASTTLHINLLTVLATMQYAQQKHFKTRRHQEKKSLAQPVTITNQVAKTKVERMKGYRH